MVGRNRLASGRRKLSMNWTKAAKILAPVLIVLAVASIWWLKNSQDGSNGTGGSGVETGNPDFALHVTEKINLDRLKSYGIPIVVDFGADSCIPCKEMAPILRDINEELRGKAIVKFVDVWKYPGLVDGYPMSVIPTQLFIDSSGKPYVPRDPNILDLQMYSTEGMGKPVFTVHEGGLTKGQILSILKEMGMEQ
jgi:thioredoxin 1